jgi:hypothetical protein
MTNWRHQNALCSFFIVCVLLSMICTVHSFSLLWVVSALSFVARVNVINTSTNRIGETRKLSERQVF